VDFECLPRLSIYPLAIDIGLLNEKRLVFQLRIVLLARDLAVTTKCYSPEGSCALLHRVVSRGRLKALRMGIAVLVAAIASTEGV
jgi:hypothetical protein